MAMLAAAGFLGGDLTDVVGAMMQVQRSIAPRDTFRGRFESLYQLFMEECARRGYLRRTKAQRTGDDA
jgi:hypothetical protein